MVATWRSIVMPVMGRGKLPAASAKLQVRALEEHGKRCGEQKMVEITLIANEAPLPEADTRAVLDAGVPIVSPYYACVSAVFEGSGFRAALVRGVLTSFQLLSRTKYPQKVFSNIDDCAKWMFPQAQAVGMVVAGPEEIAMAVKMVRQMAVDRGIFSPHGAVAAAAEASQG
jgi:predicted phage tail protein